MIDKAWKEITNATTIDEASDLAERSIKETYRDFSTIFQPGYMPEIQLIYGLTAGSESRLFESHGPIVNEVNDHASGGCGHYMADFLAKKMHGTHLTTKQCVFLAAYVLSEAKEHVDGCGGSSQIAVLRPKKPSGLVDPGVIDELTGLLQSCDPICGEILLDCADLECDNAAFSAKLKPNIENLETWRDHYKEKLSEAKEFLAAIWADLPNTDYLGLPKE